MAYYVFTFILFFFLCFQTCSSAKCIFFCNNVSPEDATLYESSRKVFFPCSFHEPSHFVDFGAGAGGWQCLEDIHVYDIDLNLTLARTDPYKYGFSRGNDDELLVVDRDYSLSLDEHGMTLELLPTKDSWITGKADEFPRFLVLRGVFTYSSGSENLSPDPKVVAKILRRPMVDCDLQKPADKKILIRGQGFTRDTRLFFRPVMHHGRMYEMMVLNSREVLILLLEDTEWPVDSTTLAVTSIDSGGGRVKLNGRYGVVVATLI